MTSSHFRVVHYTADGCYTREHPRALINSDVQIPQIAFKQYIPLNNTDPSDGSVTIIGGHANGIPKEVYEPLFIEVLQRAEQNHFRIRSFWIADSYDQGQSGILNEELMGNDPCWTDHSRDLLMFINRHRDKMPQPLVALGHSLGASQLVHLSLMHPALFKALIFLEPGWSRNPGSKAAAPTLKRRDLWPTKDVAIQEFRKSNFYGIWDPRCLGLYVEHGLRDAASRSDDASFDERDSKFHKVGAVLTTSRHQELATLLRPNENAADDAELDHRFERPEATQLLARLPELRPPTLYVWGGKSGPWSAAKKEIFENTGTGRHGSGGRNTGSVRQACISGGTHFVPLEKPAECAEQVALFLGVEIRKWALMDRKIELEWRTMARSEQLQADRRILNAFGKAKQNQKL